MNYYEILKINSDASKDEIQQAYDRMKEFYQVIKRSSEKEFAAEMLKEIEYAYMVLKDNYSKRAYDEYLLKQNGGKIDTIIKESSPESYEEVQYIEIDGKRYLFPFLLQELTDSGWGIADRYKNDLIGKDLTKIKLTKGLKDLWLEVCADAEESSLDYAYALHACDPIEEFSESEISSSGKTSANNHDSVLEKKPLNESLPKTENTEKCIWQDSESICLENTEDNQKSIKKSSNSEMVIKNKIGTDVYSKDSKGNLIDFTFSQIIKGEIYSFGWYEHAEIEWIVLDKKDTSVLLLSRYALDSKPYHTGRESLTWESCALRKWLNREFITSAFDSDEQNMINKTTVNTDPNPEYGISGGNSTEDKIFLLSINEVEKYFDSDEARICIPTEYAKANGVWTYYKTGTCWWWLRSPGYESNDAAVVRSGGWVSSVGYYVNNDDGGLRPALWINLKS